MLLSSSSPLAPLMVASGSLLTGLLLLLRIPGAESATERITCYGVGGDFPYVNNTRCPGSNVCCGVEATCLSNGLCHDADDADDLFIRGPCAVRPYDTATCAKVCVYNETEEGNFLPRVTVCSDGSYCCSNDAQCCDMGRGVFLDVEGNVVESPASTTFSYGPERTAATFIYTPPSAILASVTTSASTSTSTSSAETTMTTTTGTANAASETGAASSGEASGSTGGGDSTSLKVGLGLGVPLVAIVTAGAVWFFMRRRSQAKQQQQQDQQQLQQSPPAGSGNYGGYGHWGTPSTTPMSEIEGNKYSPPSELDTGRTPAELGT